MIYPILAVLGAIFVFVTVIGVLARRENPDSGAKSFGLMALGIAWWIGAMVLGHLFDQALEMHALFVLLTRVEWFGIFVMAVSWFLFVLAYTGQTEYATGRIARLLLAAPLVVYPVAFANGLVLDAVGSILGLSLDLTASFDPWLTVEPLILAYLYSLLAASTLLLLVYLFTNRLPYPEVAILWLLALIIPWIVNALYVVGVIPPLGEASIDPTPFGFVGLAGVGFLAIRRSQSFSRSPLARAYVVDNLDVGILVVNGEWQIVDANEYARSILGLETGGVGRDVREVLESAVEDEGVFGGATEQVESLVEMVDGSVFTVGSGEDARNISIEVAPLERSAGELTVSVDSFGLVLRDVTTRLKRQQTLERQTEQLGVLNQVLRHDIRNDLQLVISYAELVEEQVPEEHQEYVETLQENAQHAVDLTTTARDMATVLLSEDVGREPVALDSTLEAELDEIRATYPDAAVSVDGTVPKVQVLANGMLDSVFRNLLKNAIQHNDQTTPRVTVSASETGGAVEVRIADNGPGVPDERKESIFGKGERGLESDGTGLGLYLVKSLVESYDGDVRIEDNQPQGAVFVVDLPTVTTDT